MMRKIFFLFVLLTGVTVFAQTNNDSLAVNESIENESIADFPGGLNFFRQKIAENFREKKVKGKGRQSSMLWFTVDRDGTLTDIKAQGDNESFNREAIRAVSLIKTPWKPATINGQKVRYLFRVPLNLDL